MCVDSMSLQSLAASLVTWQKRSLALCQPSFLARQWPLRNRHNFWRRHFVAEYIFPNSDGQLPQRQSMMFMFDKDDIELMKKNRLSQLQIDAVFQWKLEAKRFVHETFSVFLVGKNKSQTVVLQFKQWDPSTEEYWVLRLNLWECWGNGKHRSGSSWTSPMPWNWSEFDCVKWTSAWQNLIHFTTHFDHNVHCSDVTHFQTAAEESVGRLEVRNIDVLDKYKLFCQIHAISISSQHVCRNSFFVLFLQNGTRWRLIPWWQCTNIFCGHHGSTDKFQVEFKPRKDVIGCTTSMGVRICFFTKFYSISFVCQLFFKFKKQTQKLFPWRVRALKAAFVAPSGNRSGRGSDLSKYKTFDDIPLDLEFSNKAFKDQMTKREQRKGQNVNTACRLQPGKTRQFLLCTIFHVLVCVFAEQSPTDSCHAFYSSIDRGLRRKTVVMKSNSKKRNPRTCLRKPSSPEDVKKSFCSEIVQGFKKFTADSVQTTRTQFSHTCQNIQKDAALSMEEIIRKMGDDRDREFDEANRAMKESVRIFREDLTKKMQEQKTVLGKYAGSLREDTKKKVQEIMDNGTKQLNKQLQDTKATMEQERNRQLKSKSAEFKKQFNDVLSEIADQRQQIVKLGIQSALLEVTRRFEENASDEHIRSLLHVARDEFLTKARAIVDQSIDDSFVDNCNSVASQAAGLDAQQKMLAISKIGAEKAIVDLEAVESEKTHRALANLRTTHEQAIGLVISPSPKFVNMTNHLHLFSSCIGMKYLINAIAVVFLEGCCQDTKHPFSLTMLPSREMATRLVWSANRKAGLGRHRRPNNGKSKSSLNWNEVVKLKNLFKLSSGFFDKLLCFRMMMNEQEYVGGSCLQAVNRVGGSVASESEEDDRFVHFSLQSSRCFLFVFWCGGGEGSMTNVGEQRFSFCLEVLPTVGDKKTGEFCNNLLTHSGKISKIQCSVDRCVQTLIFFHLSHTTRTTAKNIAIRRQQFDGCARLSRNFLCLPFFHPQCSWTEHCTSCSTSHNARTSKYSPRQVCWPCTCLFSLLYSVWNFLGWNLHIFHHICRDFLGTTTAACGEHTGTTAGLEADMTTTVIQDGEGPDNEQMQKK